MASLGLQGNALAFAYAAGSNLDPAATSHMHEATIESVLADEIKSTWLNSSNGKPDPCDEEEVATHPARLRLPRP